MKTKKSLLLLLMALTLCVSVSFAGGKNVDPVKPRYEKVVRNAIRFMAGTNMNGERFLRKLEASRKKTQQHVCVCEILKLENNNDHYDEVALMSEMTDNGDLSSEYRAAGKQLVAERKRLKELFFSLVKVSEKVNAPVDCVSLYLMLADKRSDLLMYDILDSDILSVRR